MKLVSKLQKYCVLITKWRTKVTVAYTRWYDYRIIKVILVIHEGLSNKHILSHHTYNPQEDPEDDLWVFAGSACHSLLFRNQDKTAAVHISSFNGSYQELSVKA